MYKVNFIKIKFLMGLVFMAIFFSIPFFSFSEMQISTQEEEIIVSVSPTNPEPYENVSIILSSYATDLNKASIVWNMDSKIVLSGVGKTSYLFKASAPDTKINFSITIKPDGSMSAITKNITILPSEIEVLWESVDGYTPLFYKGKALPMRGGAIKVVAIPNTKTITSGSGNISYSWKNNDEVVVDKSGYNKNSFIFTNDLFDTENNIAVTASSLGNNYAAGKTIIIPSYPPNVLFYKKSPSEGVLYNKTLDPTTTFTEDEMTIVVAPYNLGIKGNENKFKYKWTINGDPINTPSKPTELTIRPTSRGGYADISVVFESITKLFQTAAGQLKLTL